MAGEPDDLEEPRYGDEDRVDGTSESQRDAGTGPPARWQKVLGVIGVVVVLLVVVLLIVGDHGPGRHAPDGSVPESDADPEGHTPPDWAH